MFARLGFILLVLVFGVLCFLGGMAAPDDWRAPLVALAERVAQHEVVAKAPDTHGAAPASSAAKASTSPTPPALESMMVTSEVASAAPAAGQPAYALQLGQFVTANDADALLARAKVLDLPLSHWVATDASHATWTIVAAGRFVTADEASAATARVASVLGVAGGFPVVRLPAPAPSGS